MDMLLTEDTLRECMSAFREGTDSHCYRWLGCHSAGDGGYTFRVWAPAARAVSLIGEFNDWAVDAQPMEPIGDGVWECSLQNIAAYMAYKYHIIGADGQAVDKTDPFATHIETRPGTASKVCEIGGYRWQDAAWRQRKAKTSVYDCPVNIYEVHAGSWRRYADGNSFSYQKLAEELIPYVKEMGYTHIELLPIMEYPYDGSWGYQVTGYYAPTSRYGTPQDFMAFIDACHQAEIGVILDWVPAHFPKDAHGLARFDGTRLYECKDARMAEHPEWGTLIFDYEMPEVQSFLISSAMSFFDRYHIDGIRVDAVSSMLYLNYARRDGEWTPNRDGGNINLGAVAFLQKLNTTVLTAWPGCVTVAEESSAYPGVTKPPYDGGLGFSFKWDMGFMHDTLDYLELDPYFRKYHHDKLTFSMMYAFSENFILAFSHDEVVHGKKSMLDKMYGTYEQKFATLRALYGYQFAHPGKKLTFMGSEFGQFIEWNYKQGLDWLLLDYPMHKAMQRWCSALNACYRSIRALWDIDDGWDGFTWLNVDDAERSAIAFLRTARNGRRLVCVCNFTPVRYEDFVIGLPRRGVLRELLSSDSEEFGGSGVHNAPEIRSENVPFGALPYSARVTLPELAAVYFTFTNR